MLFRSDLAADAYVASVEPKTLEGGPNWSGAAPGFDQAYADRLAGLGDAEPASAESCTTHLTVADKDGMMVAMTTTLLSSMGSRTVLPETGILMNNGIMWFDPRPDSPNYFAPSKRPLTNMCPVIARRGDHGWFAIGASGGRKIMPAVMQISSFLIDHGMTLEEIGRAHV